MRASWSLLRSIQSNTMPRSFTTSGIPAKHENPAPRMNTVSDICSPELDLNGGWPSLSGEYYARGVAAGPPAESTTTAGTRAPHLQGRSEWHTLLPLRERNEAKKVSHPPCGRFRCKN